jgi:hypothetical protein
MYDYACGIDNLWLCMREWTNITCSTQNRGKSQDKYRYMLTVLNSKNKPSTKHEKDEYEKIST